MTRMYELTEQYSKLASTVDEGTEDEALFDMLGELKGSIEDKAIGLVKVFKNLDAEANAIKEAEKSMAVRRKVKENQAERLKQYLFDNMMKVDAKLIECPYFVIKIKKKPPSVNILDEDKIPLDFMDYPVAPDPKPDKQAILKAYREGGDDFKGIAGVEIVRGKRVEIK